VQDSFTAPASPAPASFIAPSMSPQLKPPPAIPAVIEPILHPLTKRPLVNPPKTTAPLPPTLLHPVLGHPVTTLRPKYHQSLNHHHPTTELYKKHVPKHHHKKHKGFSSEYLSNFWQPYLHKLLAPGTDQALYNKHVTAAWTTDFSYPFQFETTEPVKRRSMQMH
jgi:hypothetical protein